MHKTTRREKLSKGFVHLATYSFVFPVVWLVGFHFIAFLSTPPLLLHLVSFSFCDILTLETSFSFPAFLDTVVIPSSSYICCWTTEANTVAQQWTYRISRTKTEIRTRHIFHLLGREEREMLTQYRVQISGRKNVFPGDRSVVERLTVKKYVMGLWVMIMSGHHRNIFICGIRDMSDRVRFDCLQRNGLIKDRDENIMSSSF